MPPRPTRGSRPNDDGDDDQPSRHTQRHRRASSATLHPCSVQSRSLASTAPRASAAVSGPRGLSRAPIILRRRTSSMASASSTEVRTSIGSVARTRRGATPAAHASVAAPAPHHEEEAQTVAEVLDATNTSLATFAPRTSSVARGPDRWSRAPVVHHRRTSSMASSSSMEERPAVRDLTRSRHGASTPAPAPINDAARTQMMAEQSTTHGLSPSLARTIQVPDLHRSSSSSLDDEAYDDEYIANIPWHSQVTNVNATFHHGRSSDARPPPPRVRRVIVCPTVLCINAVLHSIQREMRNEMWSWMRSMFVVKNSLPPHSRGASLVAHPPCALGVSLLPHSSNLAVFKAIDVATFFTAMEEDDDDAAVAEVGAARRNPRRPPHMRVMPDMIRAQVSPPLCFSLWRLKALRHPHLLRVVDILTIKGLFHDHRTSRFTPQHHRRSPALVMQQFGNMDEEARDRREDEFQRLDRRGWMDQRHLRAKSSPTAIGTHPDVCSCAACQGEHLLPIYIPSTILYARECAHRSRPLYFHLQEAWSASSPIFARGGAEYTRGVHETAREHFVRLSNSIAFSVDRMADIIYQVSCGLSHLHSNGTLHGNLHYHNIFMSEDGHASLADFGLPLFPDNLMDHTAGPLMMGNDQRMLSQTLPSSECSAFYRVNLEILQQIRSGFTNPCNPTHKPSSSSSPEDAREDQPSGHPARVVWSDDAQQLMMRLHLTPPECLLIVLPRDLAEGVSEEMYDVDQDGVEVWICEELRTEAADCYAVGVLWYAMAFGAFPPFSCSHHLAYRRRGEASPPYELLRQHSGGGADDDDVPSPTINEGEDDPPHLRADAHAAAMSGGIVSTLRVDASVRQLIGRLLHPNPAQRLTLDELRAHTFFSVCGRQRFFTTTTTPQENDEGQPPSAVFLRTSGQEREAGEASSLPSTHEGEVAVPPVPHVPVPSVGEFILSRVSATAQDFLNGLDTTMMEAMMIAATYDEEPRQRHGHQVSESVPDLFL